MKDGEGLVQQIFEARWICNGFPKSGTHLLVQMVHPLAPYQGGTDAGIFVRPWAGTFLDNSWTNRWSPIEQTCFKCGRVENGHMVKAHLGYLPELERFLYLLGVIHLFIYRDLRDVAVSQAWHIINAASDKLAHPRPEAYPQDDFDETLALVIAGTGEFPGVISRWSYYKGWLTVPWVMSLRYENLLDEPQEWAGRIFRYAMRQHADRWGKKVSFDPDGLEMVTRVMAKASQNREKSPTFREGKTGGWRDAFTERHCALWREYDPRHYLVTLGYEREEWYAGTERPDGGDAALATEPNPRSDPQVPDRLAAG